MAEHHPVSAAIGCTRTRHRGWPRTGGGARLSLRSSGSPVRLAAVRGVGETGLDHFRTGDAEGRQVQEESFRRHIALAKTAGQGRW